MSETCAVTIDGVRLEVPCGTTLAAAIASRGTSAFRKSVRGEPRGPLCGMGICFECRVTVDGRAHIRSCQIRCRNGMDVSTDG